MDPIQPQSPIQPPVTPLAPESHAFKNLWLGILALLILLVVFLAGSAWKEFMLENKEESNSISQNSTSEWKKYINHDFGFEFQYPAGLDIDAKSIGSTNFDKRGVEVHVDTPDYFEAEKCSECDGGSAPLISVSASEPITPRALDRGCDAQYEKQRGTVIIGGLTVDVCEGEEMRGAYVHAIFTQDNKAIYNIQFTKLTAGNDDLVGKVLSTFKFVE